MKRQNFWKRICAFLLVLCMVFALPLSVSADIPPEDYMPESSPDEESNPPSGTDTDIVTEIIDTQPLRANDNLFTLYIYSAENGKYEGTFFKKDNTLYIEEETIIKLDKINFFTDVSIDKDGFINWEDEDKLHWIEPDEIYTFEDYTFYPFVEVITDLRLTAVYDSSLQALRIIPAKDVHDLPKITDKMLKNVDYQMLNWRKAKFLDADDSRAVAQSFDICRNLFSLPSTVYKYATGDADYESYRSAFRAILLPDLNTQINSLDTFKEERAFLDMVEVSGEFAKAFPVNSGFWGLVSEDTLLSGTAAGLVNDAQTIMQYKDSLEVVTYYYNMDNINAGIANGVELIYKTGSGVGNGTPFNKALEDTVAFNKGETSLSQALLEEMGDGLVEFAFSKVDSSANNTVGKFCVGALDYLGANFAPDWYNAAKQIDATITATSNLSIQDSAKRCYNYYYSVYQTSDSREKQLTALQNMRDSMLIYMLAGHNAWKAMEFDKDMETFAKKTSEKMAKEIKSLLNYGTEDFRVYENALDAKHAIMADYAERKQTYYFFKWDKEKANEIGGVDFCLEGLDKNGASYLHKYMFSHVYYLRNGLFVGRVTNTGENVAARTLESYETPGVCEVVIRPKTKGASVADIDLTVATGLSNDYWTGDLSQYLVTEDNGNVIYRIPLPLGSAISDGTALPTVTVTSSKVEYPSGGNGDGDAGQTTNKITDDNTKYPSDFNYVPTGPFDSEYSVEYRNNYKKYRISIPYNSDLLYVMGEPDFYYARVAFKDDKEDIEEKYFADINYFYKDFEYIKATFLEDEDIVVTEFKEIIFPNSTVKMYVFYNKNWPNNVRYEFFGDLGIGINLNGNYYPEKVMDKDALTFEQFILELFSNITVETLTWP